MPVRPPSDEARRCKVAGCKRPRGKRLTYCDMHKKRLERTGRLTSPLDCVVEGCWDRRRIIRRGFSPGNWNGPTERSDFCAEHDGPGALARTKYTKRLLEILESGAFDFRRGILVRAVRDPAGVLQQAEWADGARLRRGG